jgi:NitT/TauT family transport system substrate-binding protein
VPCSAITLPKNSPTARQMTPASRPTTSAEPLAGPPTVLSRRAILTGASLAVVGASAACGGPARKHRRGLDKVTFVTALGTNGRDSYAHVAKAKGFFADAGLDVAIEPGKAGDYNNQMIATGRAQFAAVDASGALVRYGTGADTSFRIVAGVHHTTLISIIGLDGKLTSPKDLQGRTIGTVAGAVPQTLFPAYARLAGVDDRTVSWVNAQSDQLPQLLIANKLDGAALFIVARAGIDAAAPGRHTTALAYSDYMSDLLGAVVIASRKLVTSSPDLVRRFVGALMRGLDYAVTHPDEAGQILHTAIPIQNPTIASTELTLMRPYVIASGHPIGAIDPTRLAKSVALLKSMSLIPPTAPVDIATGILAATASTGGA